MRTSWTVLLAVLLAVGVSACSSGSSSGPVVSRPDAPPPAQDQLGSQAGAGQKPTKTPADLVGKWRIDVTEGMSSRKAVYEFKEDGSCVVETRLKTDELEAYDKVKGEILSVDGDRLTIVDVSRTSEDGVETAIPPENRRNRVIRYKVAGDELTWRRADDKSGTKPWVMKRVKE